MRAFRCIRTIWLRNPSMTRKRKSLARNARLQTNASDIIAARKRLKRACAQRRCASIFRIREPVMRNNLLKISAFVLSTMFAGSAYARPPLKADEPMENPVQPKKKAGEECKTAAECKRHHTCSPSGTKRVCTAVQLKDIPKT